MHASVTRRFTLLLLLNLCWWTFLFNYNNSGILGRRHKVFSLICYDCMAIALHASHWFTTEVLSFLSLFPSLCSLTISVSPSILRATCSLRSDDADDLIKNISHLVAKPQTNTWNCWIDGIIVARGSSLNVWKGWKKIYCSVFHQKQSKYLWKVTGLFRMIVKINPTCQEFLYLL